MKRGVCMDIEKQARREEVEADVQEVIRELNELENKLNEGMLDARSYNNGKLFLKKQLAKAQRALDELG